jgi:DNA-directed RNA polymerase specialized sigma24 family protein
LREAGIQLEDDVEPRLADVEVKDLCASFEKRLPEPLRQVWRWVLDKRLSSREMAARMKISQSTLKREARAVRSRFEEFFRRQSEG